MRCRSTLCVVLLLLLGSALRAQDGGRSDDFFEGNLAPALDKAGLDRKDSASMIRAIRSTEPPLTKGASEETLIRAAAIHELGRMPKSEAAVRELTRLLESQDETTVLAATISLVKLKESTWVARVLPRLDAISIPWIRVRLAGRLATTGEYTGWPMVKLALTDPDQLVADAALDVIEAFAGMKDAKGKPLDVAEELSIALARMPTETRSRAQHRIESLRP
jgi:HEAT repeat protein